MNLQTFYTYSWFANLAYVNWRETSIGLDPVLDDVIEDANDAQRVPGDVKNPDVLTLGGARPDQGRTCLIC